MLLPMYCSNSSTHARALLAKSLRVQEHGGQYGVSSHKSSKRESKGSDSPGSSY